jgi:REP element-mobilizing transposase RayT
MSNPRQVLPGRTYLITRRTSERRFFLKPVDDVVQVFLYVLAVAAQRHGIEVHAFCCLSNHFHLIVTDPDGKLPEFMHLVDCLLARSLNSKWGKSESFWAPASYSRVELVEDDDVIAKMVYTLTNPVSSGLVRSSHHWPGARSGVLQGGEERSIHKKPKFFFRPEGTLPAIAELRVVRPSAKGNLTDTEFSQLLWERIDRREGECRAERERSGKGFLGKERVLRQPPFDSPASHARRQKLNPSVAAKDKWRRIEALQRLVSFRHAYREAFEAFRNGIRDVIFPAGTYWLRRYCGVRCEAAPT